MDSKQKNVLNKIVELDGNCLSSKLCTECPFKTKCLPEFLDKKSRPTKRERYEMALDVLARVDIMGDEDAIGKSSTHLT